MYPEDLVPTIKIIVAGPQKSGKTSLCNAFSGRKEFTEKYSITFRIKVLGKTVKIPSSFEEGSLESLKNEVNNSVSLVMLDCGGKEIFFDDVKTLRTEEDIRPPSSFICVIDLTNPSSLDSCEKWIQEIQQFVTSETNQGAKFKLGALVGNKSDLRSSRCISPKAAQNIAEKYGLKYFESSVKLKQGVEEPFFYLIHEWNISRKNEEHYKSTISALEEKSRSREA